MFPSVSGVYRISERTGKLPRTKEYVSIRVKKSETPEHMHGNCQKPCHLWVRAVENSVFLKCRKLRREDQETSDWIVSRISLFYDMCCYLQSSKISFKSFLQGIL